MTIYKLSSILGLTTLLFTTSLMCRDTIVEFKGAYFRSTDCVFKKIFNKGGALFGPEVTVQLCDDSNFYGFASIDFLTKKGKSIGLREKTRILLMPLGFGLKYMESKWCDWMQLYVGLGFQPVYVRTKDCSAFLPSKQSRWGFGGIVKAGTYIDIACNFVLDLFIDYSFVKTSCKKNCAGTISRKANLSGAIFGGGIGYRF